jgi:hypothetical protein
MKYMCTMNEIDSNPISAGAPQFEITPEMIEAGQRCLDDLFDATVEAGSESGLMCIPGGWAEAVYRAMHRMRCRRAGLDLSHYLLPKSDR